MVKIKYIFYYDDGGDLILVTNIFLVSTRVILFFWKAIYPTSCWNFKNKVIKHFLWYNKPVRENHVITLYIGQI